MMSDISSTKWLDKIILGSMLALLAALTFSSALVEISFVIAAICWIFKNVTRRTFMASLKFIPGMLLLTSYALIVLLTSFWTENYELSFKGILKVFQQITILALAFDTFKSKENLKILAIFISSLVTVVILNSLIQYAFGKDLIRGFSSADSSAGQRVTGSFKSYGLLATFMIMALPICAGIYGYFRDLNSSRVYQALCVFSMLAGLFILFLTRSRGAALAFGVGTVFMLVVNQKFKLLGILCLLGVLTFTILPKGMIIHLDNKGQEQSLVERYYLWDRAVYVIKARPLTGTGINTYAESHMAYDQTKSWRVTRYYAHNGYLQLAAETGLPSLLFYLAFLGVSIWAGIRFSSNQGERRCYRMLVLGFTGGCLNFCLFAIVDTVMHNPLPVMTFWYFMGCLLGVIAHPRLTRQSDSFVKVTTSAEQISKKGNLFSLPTP